MNLALRSSLLHSLPATLQHDNGTQSSGRQQKAEGEREVRLLALPVGFLLARQQLAALTAWDACSQQQAGTGVILLYLRCRHMRCSIPIFREYGRPLWDRRQARVA